MNGRAGLTRTSRRYYVLHANIFTQADWDRFGCGFFADRGYEVVPVDILNLASPNTRAAMAHENFKDMDGVRLISSLDEFEGLVKEMADSDFVLVTPRYETHLLPLYRALSRHKINYACLSLGNIPTVTFRRMAAALNLGEYLSYKFDDVLGVAYRIKRFVRAIMQSKGEVLRLRPPKWWIRAGDHYSPFDFMAPRVWKADIISTRTFDTLKADCLADADVDTDVASLGAKKPYAVIIDDGYLDHPDFAYVNEEFPVTWDRFSKGMNALLEKVERDLGLDVIVCGHPKTTSETLQKLYGGRLIFQGRTAELVAGCDLSIISCSTAVSFAVRKRKPVLFFTSDELECDPFFGPFIARMSSWLGQRRVNIDHLDANTELTLPVVREDAYRDYEKAFLATADASPLPIWEAVASRVEHDLAVMA